MLIRIGNAWVDPSEVAAVLPESDGDNVQLALRSGQSHGLDCSMEEAEEDLIACGLITDPTGCVVPRLSAEETGELKHLYALGYAYIARDMDGKLYAFSDVPQREGAYWDDHSTVAAIPN